MLTLFSSTASLLRRRRFLLLTSFLLGLLSCGAAWAREFSVAMYNVENLFDVDGRAAYEDYQPGVYGPAQLRTKVTNISRVLAKLEADGKGPDIIGFCEVEVDQTPSAKPVEVRSLLATQPGKTADQLLSSALSPELKDWPAEAWLLRAAEDQGLLGYQVVVGSDLAADKYEDGNTRAVKCVLFTRFPVKEVRNHRIPNARNILEVLLDVDGHPLRVFVNHWKSGAGDAATERLRVEDARVLRTRLDELLAADPHADIVIGGDFNSQYNQKQRYPQMKETGINDVLRSQGDELALRDKADLYNLWYELPRDERGSDVYHNEWGTLIQLLVTRGLYDQHGIQYVDGSFRVGRIRGLNVGPDNTPLRWSGEGRGSGFSDHFPIIAHFRTVDGPGSNAWVELKNPSDGITPSDAPRAGYAVAQLASVALDTTKLPPGADLRDGSYNGRIVLVEGHPIAGQRLAVEALGQEWEVYSPEPRVRDQLRTLWKTAGRVRFYGELGQYKGRWQFVLRQADWLISTQ
jgi:hypothetical protein